MAPTPTLQAHLEPTSAPGPLRPHAMGRLRHARSEMSDWAWVTSRLDECDGHRPLPQTAAHRRDEALDSATRLMMLFDEATERATRSH